MYIYLIRYQAKCNNCVPKCTIYRWYFWWIDDTDADDDDDDDDADADALCCVVFHCTNTRSLFIHSTQAKDLGDMWCKAVVKHITKYSCRRIYANLLSKCVNSSLCVSYYIMEQFQLNASSTLAKQVEATKQASLRIGNQHAQTPHNQWQ